jgi:Neuraminidase (sialidase)
MKPMFLDSIRPRATAISGCARTLLLVSMLFLARLCASAVDQTKTTDPTAVNSVSAVLPTQHHLTLSPGPGNPRNSEGDFIKLKDGRYLFIYSHFTGGAGDHARAFLASRESRDNGMTWSTNDVTVVTNEGGFNVMSVSLLRLQSGEIGLFYARKNSLRDCRLVARFSQDEAKTWSAPVECITDETNYFVVNNDRVIQLASGRLLFPAARHSFVNGKLGPGAIMTYSSDDTGRTWRRGKALLETDAEGKRVNFMEPGIVQTATNRLLMVIRTKLGCLYMSESTDQGETWMKPRSSQLLSPESPATLTKIPATGDLLMIWNDHAGKPLEYRTHQPPIRNPLVVAISRDGGRTWVNKKIIEDQPGHGFCYTAVAFEGDRILLAYCSNRSGWGLEQTQISSIEVADLYR